MAALSAALRYYWLAQTPYANGWDSYFYLVQVKSWVEEGAMHSPEASLIYPFLRAVLFFTGDYVQMYKVGAAVLAGSFTFMVFAVAQSIGKTLPRSAGLAVPMLWGAWAVCSPHLGSVAAQYPKTLLRLVVWLWLAVVLEKKGPGRWSFAVLVANYFGHRLTFGLAVVYGGLWWLFRYKKRGMPPWFIRKTVLVAGLSLFFLILATPLLPGLFQFADMGRLGNILHWPPQFAPCSFVQTFGRERLSAWWLLEIAVATVLWAALGLFFLISTLRRRFLNAEKRVVLPVGIQALWWLCAGLLFPLLEWSYTGISYRFFLVFVLIGPLLWGALGQCFEQRGTFVAYVGAGILVLGSFYIHQKGYNPLWHDPDYAGFNRIATQTQAYFDKNNLEKPELLICHNALAEYYTFTTGTDAMPWLPEYPLDSSRLWRLAAGIHPQTLRYFARSAGDTPMVSLGNGYVLLPEHCWQSAIRMAEKEGDPDFLKNARSWLNPHKKRPEWLLNRKTGGQ